MNQHCCRLVHPVGLVDYVSLKKSIWRLFFSRGGVWNSWQLTHWYLPPLNYSTICGYYQLRQLWPVVPCSSGDSKAPRRRWFRPLLSVAWTTVTRCATTPLTNWRAACSLFRTLPPGSWRAPGDAIISPLAALASCAAASRVQDCDSRPPVLVRQRPGLPGRRLSARRRRPCQTTAFCRHSNTPCQSDAQQFWRQDLCYHRTTNLLPNLRLCWLSYVSSGGYWRHFYSDSEATARLTVPNRIILTYLFIPLIYNLLRKEL